jgi:hypothetical protein
MANLPSLTVNDTGNLTLPNGTSANRPSLYSSTAIQWTNTGSQAYSVIAGSGGTVSNTSWTCPTGVTSIEVLVVAGGGAGGGTHGGGGGGGGVIYNSAFLVTPGTAYTVTVGTGGVSTTNTVPGVSGNNSVFGTLTAIGGGGGGMEGNSGSQGGSGGGGGGKGGSINNVGSGIAGQGNPGGRGTDNSPYNGGGGGGAGGPGQPATTAGGTGGPGVQYSISGTPTYYAGGGGGNCYGPNSGTLIGFGGVGGGGNGGIYQTGSTTLGTAGTASTGGGGGGNYLSTQQYGMAGGSGIVIIRFALATATTMATGQTRFNTTAGAIEEFTNTKWTPQSTGDNIVTNGLLIHLDASKYTSGATWYDLTGNGNNGTLINGVTFSTNYTSPELFTTNAGSTSDGNSTTGLAVGYGSAIVTSVVAENSVTPTNGTYQLKISGTNNGERIDYAFPVTAGKSYEVSFYARQYQGSIYFLGYIATSNSGDNLGSAIGSAGAFAVNGSTYTKYTTTFTATTHSTYYLCWRMGSSSSPANITYIDQVSIKEIVNTAGAPAMILPGGNALIDLNTTSYALGIRRQATYAAWAMVTGAGSLSIPSDYAVTASGSGIEGGMTLRFGPNNITFYVYPNNSRINITQILITGVWYHIVAVMDNYMMYAYLNGQLVGSQTLANAMGTSSPSTLKIGPRGDGDYTAGGTGPIGAIGCLQVYGRTLSPEEVRLNYNAQASRYGKTPLLDYDDNKWRTVNLSELQRPNLWAFSSGYGNQSINGTSGYLYLGNTSAGNNAANWQAILLDNNVLGSVSYAPGWRSWDSTYRLGYAWGWSTWAIRTAASVTGLAGNGTTTTSGATPTIQGGAHFNIMNNSSNNLRYISYNWWNGTADTSVVLVSTSPGYAASTVWRTTVIEGIASVWAGTDLIGRWDLTDDRLYANTPVTKDTRWLYLQNNQSDCFTEIQTLRVR